MRKLLMALAFAVSAASCGSDAITAVEVECMQPVYEHNAKTGELAFVDSIYTCETLR